MDVWYDLLVRELTDLDRAKELRHDAEERFVLDDTEDGPEVPPSSLWPR